MIAFRVEKMPLYLRNIRLIGRMFMAWMLNRFNRGVSTCLHCSRNWAICKSHVTHYTKDMGVFPLCEGCWQDLSITERLYYYYMLWDLQGAGVEKWHLVEKAVKEGG